MDDTIDIHANGVIKKLVSLKRLKKENTDLKGYTIQYIQYIMSYAPGCEMIMG